MGATPSRPQEGAESWEDHFHHEYEKPTETDWSEEDESEAAVSVHLGARLVRRLQHRQHGGAAGRPVRHTPREEPKEVDSLEFEVALPPALSDEELDSLSLPPLPPFVLEGEDDHTNDSATAAVVDDAPQAVPYQRRGGASQADREFAQEEVAEVRKHFQAELEQRHATEVAQLHRLRSLLDDMTRHRRLSGDSCEAERSACLECYNKEKDDPLACALQARAFKQCATSPASKKSSPA